MIKVLIADDHMMVRDVLRRLLERADDMQIVATASNGQESVEQAVLHYPNVAVMDFSMPIMDGVEATKQICARCPQTRVLMFSIYSAPWYIQRSVKAGALGYVLKEAAGDDLVIAVRSLHQGNRYYSKQIAEIAKRYIQ